MRAATIVAVCCVVFARRQVLRPVMLPSRFDQICGLFWSLRTKGSAAACGVACARGQCCVLCFNLRAPNNPAICFGDFYGLRPVAIAGSCSCDLCCSLCFGLVRLLLPQLRCCQSYSTVLLGQCCRLRDAVRVAVYAEAMLLAHLSTVFSVLYAVYWMIN